MAKLAFLQHIWYETMGPMYLSASVKSRGHACDVFIGREDRIVREALAARPDIICFSAMTAQFPWALGVAREIKRARRDVLVAFGGAHATFFPDIIEEDAIDIICVGEGELSLSELADRVDSKGDVTTIKNLWAKRGGRVYKNDVRDLVADLDSLPLPDRSLYYKYGFLARSPEKSFMSGRGCPYRCTFCFNHLTMQLYKGKGSFVRHRKVENVIDEIKEVKRRYGLELVYFQDDTWVLNKKWLYEFLPKYKKEIDLPFIAYVRADMVDGELVSALKDAGCRVVDMGVETGDEVRRNEILKKKISDEQLTRAARLFRKHRLNFRTTNMLGLPGETLSDAYKTLEVNMRLKPTFSWCSIFQPFPRLELTERALQEGFVSKDDLARIGGSYKASLLAMPDIEKIVNLQKFFIFTVKFPFFLPLVRVLIRFPRNIAFDTFGFLSYACMYYRYTKTSFVRLLREAVKMFFERSYEHVS